MAAALDAMCAPGQPLHVEAWHSSWRLHGLGDSPYGVLYDAARLRLHELVIERYLDDQDSPVPQDGYAAIVTAGAPGAGKSRAIDDDPTYKQWRRIDADRVKELLLGFDVLRPSPEPAYIDLLSTALPDGGTVMPMELAGLVHHESTRIADEIAARCRLDGENLVIEGTLGWDRQASILAEQFALSGYESIRVALVEHEQDVVTEQAMTRWWSGRTAGYPGGRFTPTAAITSLYDLSHTPGIESGDQTTCAAHARLLIAEAHARHIDADFL